MPAAKLAMSLFLVTASAFSGLGCVRRVESRLQGIAADVSVEQGELVIEDCDLEYRRTTTTVLWDSSTTKTIERTGCTTRTEPLPATTGAAEPEDRR